MQTRTPHLNHLHSKAALHQPDYPLQIEIILTELYLFEITVKQQITKSFLHNTAVFDKQKKPFSPLSFKPLCYLTLLHFTVNMWPLV